MFLRNALLPTFRAFAAAKAFRPLVYRAFTTAQKTEAQAKTAETTKTAEAPKTEAKPDPRDEAIKKLQKQLEEAKNKTTEWKKELHYSLAENESIIRRYKEQIETTKEYAITKFVKDLLEVQENFKRALQSISKPELDKIAADSKAKMELFDNFVVGIQMTQEVMTKALKKNGVIEYNPVGEKFNPNYHEAVFEMKDPKKENGIIGEVTQGGYKIGKRILRAPKVGVVKNPKA